MPAVIATVYLLTHNAPLNAVVPAARVYSGTPPLKLALPAISVHHISTVPLNMVASEPTFNQSRVQVTVHAASYPQLKAIQSLVRDALPRTRGTVNGVNVDSILRDFQGPDFEMEAGVHSGSQDYIVRFNE